MLRLFLFVILIFSIPIQNIFAQFENTDVGAKPIALGGAFTALSNNSIAIFYNPSGPSQMPFREFSVFYSPAPFGLTELSYGAFTYIEPTKFGTFGIAGKKYGFELYSELTGVLNYSNEYQKKFYYGLNFNFYNLKIERYGSASTFSLDIGILTYLTDYLRLGFSALNINRARIGQTREKLPQVYRTGLAINLKKDLTLLLDMEKDTRFDASVKSGLEYNLYNMIDLRLGIGSEPTKFSCGIGIYYSLFQLDYGFYTHQDLGLTHQASITVNFGGSDGIKKLRESKNSLFEMDEVKVTDTEIRKTKKLREGESVNINTASVDSLMMIPYISVKMAQSIIEYRNSNGGFESIEELMNVKGIGEKKFERIKVYIRIE